MNLYIRFFDDERVVTSIDDALAFIASFQGFNLTPEFEADFRKYVDSDVVYPKRYKVRPRIYFIVIKTTATSIDEFKANGKHQSDAQVEDREHVFRPKDLVSRRLNDEMPGWYEGTINFKRIVYFPETDRYDYVDTSFSALTKAWSPMDCYNRLANYIRSREDIDQRSQLPSPKGKNFIYEYIGLKPLNELNV